MMFSIKLEDVLFCLIKKKKKKKMYRGQPSVPGRDTRPLLTPDEEAATGTRNAGSAGSGATTGIATTALVLAIVALVGAIMLWTQWSAIMDINDACSVTAVDQYSISRQFPDVTDLGWNTWSRDRQSSRYNPHISAGNSQIASITGACAGGLPGFNVSTDVGISTTITISYELGMLFAVTWGNQDKTNSRIIAFLPDCTIVWNKTITELAAQTGVGGNDGDIGVTNPFAASRTSPTIVTNRTGGINLIFADLGTTNLYNDSFCTNNVTTCGARVYSVEALDGDLLWRTHVLEGTPITGYNHQSDMITSSPNIDGNVAYFGMSSSQSGSVTTTGILSFYGRYFTIDINNGAILNIQRTNTEAQITAGNYGASVWESAPPIDIKGQRVFFGTSNLYNYSAAVVACLVADNDRRYCMPDGVIDDSVFSVSTDTFNRQWINSPYGVDAWNTACLAGTAFPCPAESGPDYDFGTGCNVIENECGQRYVVCLQKSGILFAWDADTGVEKYRTYIGPGSYLIPCWGTAFDGQNIYLSMGNRLNTNFLMLDGTLRCDGFWAAVNAWTGEIKWMTAVPCSRSSADCYALNGNTAITPDAYLVGIIDPLFLDYSDRAAIRYAPAINCYGTAAEDVRNDPTEGAAAASGGIMVTSGHMFAGDYTGHMNVFDKQYGHIIKVLDRCTQGIIYGSASVGVVPDGEQILTWGCGYGRVDFGFPITAQGNEIKMMTIPTN